MFHMYRLVYIRGTPEQNMNALQIIIDKVGGWPFTTPVYDSELAKIDEKTSLYVPFLAIPFVLLEGKLIEFHGNLFPTEPDTIPEISGIIHYPVCHPYSFLCLSEYFLLIRQVHK
jgi:hypothetical protein